MAAASSGATDDTEVDSEMLVRSTGTASKSRWNGLGPALNFMLRGASKVAMENKVGIVPEGELKVVADHLHMALGPALRGTPPAEGAASSVKLDKPEEFARVRRVLGISEQSFNASLALQEGRKESDMRSIPVTHASGKSKSFFFLSPDQYYIFKSADKHDLRTLRGIVSSYIAHLEGHPASLLPRYVAILSLRIADWRRPLDFIVMCNALGGLRPIESRFDMKGSTFRRLASSKERAKAHPVFKDEDWVNEGRALAFPNATDDPTGGGSGSLYSSREGFIHALRRDTEFLTSRRLLDYSILVGVHNLEEGAGARPSLEQTPGLVALVSPSTISYVCLIDILTSYGPKKLMETIFLGRLLGRDISCQPPGRYARRFIRFIERITEVQGGAEAAAPAAAEQREPAEAETPVPLGTLEA